MIEPNELYHYGIPGMKWGHRKARPSANANRYNSARAEYKSAKKAYNKSYRKAYNNSSIHPVSQFVTKKGKAKSNALWEAASSDAKRLNSAKSNYKSAKKAYRSEKVSKASKQVSEKTAKVRSETKRVLNDYSRHPMLAARDLVQLHQTYEVAKFVAGPAAKKGAAAVKRTLSNAKQSYYDNHPKYEY